MKFGRCTECGNTETNPAGQRLYCEGGGDPMRRHPRTVMKDINEAEAVEVFGSKDDLYAHFGLDKEAPKKAPKNSNGAPKKTPAKKA